MKFRISILAALQAVLFDDFLPQPATTEMGTTMLYEPYPLYKGDLSD